MKNQIKKPAGKKKYQKPELKIIELAADEVLIGGCKTFGGSSDFGEDHCGIFNNCAADGS